MLFLFNQMPFVFNLNSVYNEKDRQKCLKNVKFCVHDNKEGKYKIYNLFYIIIC